MSSLVSNSKLYVERRTALVAAVKQQNPGARGALVLLGGFEQDRRRFRQESNFYYLTGIEEPGAVCVIELDGRTTLFIPAVPQRSVWVAGSLIADAATAAKCGVNEVRYLGKECPGYAVSPVSAEPCYEHLLAFLKQFTDVGICRPGSSVAMLQQQVLWDQLCTWGVELAAKAWDMSPLVASLRRVKSVDEIGAIYKVVDLTMDAHEAAASVIEPGASEAQVQAMIEYMFIHEGATPAFPSIVGSGKHSTVLHYDQNRGELRKGDLVVVDIGAELDYYCADLTRTYPVSGTFTSRQREIYQLVLEAQEYIAAAAKPGVWLRNKERPEASLHHMAVAFFESRGYAKYFPHGIGHFLGLDVHDVGDYAVPLQEGDIITIEPGLYLPDEQLGVRIEDNYWIVKDGAECLSHALPKTATEIEELVQAATLKEKRSGDLLGSDVH